MILKIDITAVVMMTVPNKDPATMIGVSANVLNKRLFYPEGP